MEYSRIKCYNGIIIYALADPFIVIFIFFLVTQNTKGLLSVILEVALGSTNKHFWHHS
jgi:hypothetical protein